MVQRLVSFLQLLVFRVRFLRVFWSRLVLWIYHISVGNFFTLTALLRDRAIRQHITTVFILSLCISDLIYSVTCFPVSVAAYLDNVNMFFAILVRKYDTHVLQSLRSRHLILQELMTNKVICKLYASSLRINFGNTTFSIAGIAINRFVLICEIVDYNIPQYTQIKMC